MNSSDRGSPTYGAGEPSVAGSSIPSSTPTVQPGPNYVVSRIDLVSSADGWFGNNWYDDQPATGLRAHAKKWGSSKFAQVNMNTEPKTRSRLPDNWPSGRRGGRYRALKDKDKYSNVKTLGLSQRKELLVQTIVEGCPDITFPRMTRMKVFNWNPITVNAAFMILCQAEPRIPVRLLRDENSQFTIDHATSIFLKCFEAKYQTPDERDKVISRLMENSILVQG